MPLGQTVGQSSRAVSLNNNLEPAVCICIAGFDQASSRLNLERNAVRIHHFRLRLVAQVGKARVGQGGAVVFSGAAAGGLWRLTKPLPGCSGQRPTLHLAQQQACEMQVPGKLKLVCWLPHQQQRPTTWQPGNLFQFPIHPAEQTRPLTLVLFSFGQLSDSCSCSLHSQTPILSAAFPPFPGRF